MTNPSAGKGLISAVHGVTVTAHVSLTSPTAAVIVAVPSATPVTTPFATVATASLDDVHVKEDISALYGLYLNSSSTALSASTVTL